MVAKPIVAKPSEHCTVHICLKVFKRKCARKLIKNWIFTTEILDDDDSDYGKPKKRSSKKKSASKKSSASGKKKKATPRGKISPAKTPNSRYECNTEKMFLLLEQRCFSTDLLRLHSPDPRMFKWRHYFICGFFRKRKSYVYHSEDEEEEDEEEYAPAKKRWGISRLYWPPICVNQCWWFVDKRWLFSTVCGAFDNHLMAPFKK